MLSSSKNVLKGITQKTHRCVSYHIVNLRILACPKSNYYTIHNLGIKTKHTCKALETCKGDNVTLSSRNICLTRSVHFKIKNKRYSITKIYRT